MPHSSKAIELASLKVPFITFQDSPFKNIAQSVMSVGEITDESLLEVFINKQIKLQEAKDSDTENKEEQLSKLILSWLLWDAVINPSVKFIDGSIDKSLKSLGLKTLRQIGELEYKNNLNSCSLRDLFIKQENYK